MEAVNTIARLIKMDSKSFTFCDTKDKRGVTTQRVSAFKIHAHRLLGLNKTLRGIKIGNFSYEKQKLQLGDSKGNHFVIAMRQVEAVEHKDIMESIESLSTLGFINYFGMQRFGT